MRWKIQKVIPIGEPPLYFLVYILVYIGAEVEWFTGFAYSLEEALGMGRINQEKDDDRDHM